MIFRRVAWTEFSTAKTYRTEAFQATFVFLLGKHLSTFVRAFILVFCMGEGTAYDAELAL